MKYSHDQDVAFIDLKVDAIWEFSKEKYTGVAVSDLCFEWGALDRIHSLIDMTFESTA